MNARHRLLVLALPALVAGCAAHQTPAAPPSAAALPLVSAPSPSPSFGPIVPVEPDRVGDAIAQAEAEFDAGRADAERGRFVSAREHFDNAVQVYLGWPGGARAEPRLRVSFDQLLDRIAALEVLALREGDGFTAARSEPAAIDELLNAAMFEPPAPAATTAETVAADLARNPSELPIPLNTKVLSYVELFQGKLRPFMQGGLDRGQGYLPMIQAAFREQGLPLELAFIPLVESAFKSTAVSRVSARGMWQFMLGTAQEHGLTQDWFLDERSDPEKATRAAAQYLKTLSQMFDGDWNFALASYNAGPGRLQRAAQTSKKSDFWQISSSTRYLPRETREYVPMIFAAIIIARNPALYGFDVAPSAPLSYETVTIPGALDLKIVAEWANLTVEELQELNPELRRTTTPMSAYDLKVPVGTAASIGAKLTEADGLYRSFKFHTVRRGETLTAIARKFSVTVKELREANDLSTRARIRPQQTLMIPSRSATGLPAAPTSQGTAPKAAPGPATYRVRAGDTLFGIARQFDTTVDTLKKLNQLTSDRIKIGDRLTVRR